MFLIDVEVFFRRLSGNTGDQKRASPRRIFMNSVSQRHTRGAAWTRMTQVIHRGTGLQ